MHALRLRLALIAAAVAACLPFVADAAASGARLRVEPVAGGVLVRVLPANARPVAFTLAGRTLGRRSRAPYAILVRRHSAAPRRAPHAVWLAARDAASGSTLARVRLQPSRARPAVRVTSGPDRVTSNPGARFTFTSSNGSRTWCRLDRAREVRCQASIAYSALAPGAHAFTVRVAGVRGRTTASYAWTVLAAQAPDSASALRRPAPPSPGHKAAPPTPPTPYATPAGAVVVSTSAGLKQALGAATPTDIVLTDGVYDSDSPFWNTGGHRVYAARLGGAVLRAGFVLGHNWGPGNGLLRGLVFNVSDPAKTLHGDIVHVWGTGSRSRLLDLALDGARVLRSGIMVRQPEGVVIQRVVARNFSHWGIAVDANTLHLVVKRPPLVEDVTATDVTWSEPAASNGRSEACVWIGNTAVVRRIFAARCAWEGLWTGTAAHGAVLEDVRVVESGVGVYAEHFNSGGTTFRRLDIGPRVTTGLLCEWADPDWGGLPGCTDVVVEDSLFDTSLVGVYMDAGTTRTTVRTSVFRNQSWAAIGDHKGIANRFSGNHVSGIDPSAVAVSRDHIFQHCGCDP